MAKDRKETLNLAYWTGAWTLSMALVSFGAKFLWDYNQSISILFISINTVIGIGMIIANKRHFNKQDEMQRKVTLEAMAVALGVGVVGGLSYSMLDITNVVSGDAEISHLVVLIGLTYLGGIIIGNLRYR